MDTEDHATSNLHLVYIPNGCEECRIGSPEDEFTKIIFVSKEHLGYRQYVEGYIVGKTEYSRRSVHGLIGDIVQIATMTQQIAKKQENGQCSHKCAFRKRLHLQLLEYI